MYFVYAFESSLAKNNCTSGKCFFFCNVVGIVITFNIIFINLKFEKKDLNLFLNIMASTKVIYNITVVQYFTLSKLKKIVLTLSCAIV